MTSSSDHNEKSMVDQNMQQEEEILSPMPLAFYDPNWMNKNKHEGDLIPLQQGFHPYQVNDFEHIYVCVYLSMDFYLFICFCILIYGFVLVYIYIFVSKG